MSGSAEIRDGIRAEGHRKGDELFLRCVSDGKLRKENAMVAKARQKMEEELKKLQAGLAGKGGLKKYSRVLEKVGRLRERYPRVSQGFEINVKEHEGKAVEITYSFDSDKLGKAYDGSYYLRTNRTELTPQEIWTTYVMLTNVEDTFRCLKGELGLRPVYHSKESRVEGHIFISVLAYHLVSYIQYHVRKADIHHHLKTILSRLRTHVAVTTSMAKQHGGALHIRGCTTPTQEQRDIYQAMGIQNMPFPVKITES
ncbi:MAG: transposase [Deltaproteobacteria bacterium]|nr:transposase [Deltaproteobacteria bacterium]